MEIVKKIYKKFAGWEYAFLCLVLVVNLGMHFSIINYPDKVILDELHYTTDAKLILQEHTTSRTEHPPLGKLLVAANMAIFGDNPVGWRTFPITFGTASILLFFLICRRLNMSLLASNIAVFLLTFENLSFVQGSVAMLDVFCLTFMLLAFWLYLRRSYPLSGVAIALATLVKLTGVFAIVVIFIYWVVVRRREYLYFIGTMGVAWLAFMAMLLLFEFAIYHQVTNIVTSIYNMLTQSASLTFATVEYPFLIRPWELLYIPQVMPYYYGPHYFATISFNVWAFIIPVFIYMLVKAIKKSEAAILGLAWFAGLYLIWIPVDLITDRVFYYYYFYPMVGALCLGLGMGLAELINYWRTGQTEKLRMAAIAFVAFFLFIHLVIFGFLAPFNPYPVEQLFIYSTTNTTGT
jgi:dolichyl-phosphate-mannose-protein mannosyltransferase